MMAIRKKGVSIDNNQHVCSVLEVQMGFCLVFKKKGFSLSPA